jgi:hypothetical protein
MHRFGLAQDDDPALLGGPRDGGLADRDHRSLSWTRQSHRRQSRALH